MVLLALCRGQEMVSFSSDASCEQRDGEQPHWYAWGGMGQPEDRRDPSHVHATKQLQEGHTSSLQPGLEVASRDGTQDIADLYLGALTIV